MSKSLIVLLLCLPLFAEARPQWGLGVGLEGRFQREVNPDYIQPVVVGNFFAHAMWKRFGFQLESGGERGSTRSGGLSISTRSRWLAGWGRWRFQPEHRWKPFLGAGVGTFFDRVDSSFNGTVDRRRGTRDFFGLGGGVAAVFANHFLLEAEVRAALKEGRRQPDISLLLRVGVQF